MLLNNVKDLILSSVDFAVENINSRAGGEEEEEDP